MRKTTILLVLAIAYNIIIAQNENVGVNTTNPTERLEVKDGSVEISSIGFTDHKGLKFSETSDPLFGWIYNGINNRLHLREYFSDSSDVLSILSDGKFGIGTSSPTHWFEISRGSGFQFKLNNPSTGGDDWYIGASDDSWNMGGGKLAISDDGSSAGTVLVIDPDSDVGLGTSSPAASIHIHKSGPASKPSFARFTNSITGSASTDGMTTGMGANEDGYIWHNENEPIIIGTNNTERLRIASNGEFEVREDIVADKSLIFDYPGSSVGEGIVISEANGDAFGITDDGSGSGADNKLIFRDYVGTDSDVLSIYGDGDVQIGTAPVPSGYKVSIDGKMICEEVRVKLSENWPDYVFHEGYTLRSLPDLKKEIDVQQHLPGIPSAKEVEKNGIELGEMQRLMLEKIEELTLYIIHQDERIRELESTISSTKKESQ